MARTIHSSVIARELSRLRLDLGLRDLDIASSIGVCDRTIRNWKTRRDVINFRPAYDRNLRTLVGIVKLAKNVLPKRKRHRWIRGRDRLNHLKQGDFQRIRRRFLRLHYKLNRLEREAYEHADRLRARNRTARFGMRMEFS